MDTVAPPEPDPFPPPDPATPFAAAPLVPAPPAPAPWSAGRIGWRTGIALGLLAFLAGLAAMALVAVRYGMTFGAAKPVATLTVPVGPGGQSPVVIVPAKAGVPAPAIDLAALSGRAAELDRQLAGLEARAGAIDRAAAQASGYAGRAEGLMIAFAARRALDRGLNLGFLEQPLRARFGTAQPRAVAMVVQAAHDPVTLEDLRAGLDRIAPELTTGAASGGWWPSLARELGSLVVLRRAGTPSPLPVDRIARARRLLEAGQVAAALSEVAHTPGAAAAQGWTAAARRYLGARAALDVLEADALTMPAAAPVPSPAPAPRDVPGLGTTAPNP